MNKRLIIILVFLVTILLGCDAEAINTSQVTLDMTTSQEEITSEDLQTTREIETEEDLTTLEVTSSTELSVQDDLEGFVDDIYRQLLIYFPREIEEDYTLPIIEIEGLVIEYYFNRTILEDRFVEFQANALSINLDFFVLIEYQDFSKSYQFSITQKRDEILYQESLINQAFTEAFDQIIEQIPRVMTSDLTLPRLDILDAEVTYSVDHSFIFNQRLIFTYPDLAEDVILTVTIDYLDESRSLALPLTMSAYDDLPKIPQIHINTENNSLIESKDDYVNGQLSLFDYDALNQETLILDQVGMRIRLRGNSTMYMPKQPYKIKFDSKQYMFSDYKEKDWVLLANFADQTLIRNGLAYNLARQLDMAFSPMVKYVDLYINGIYQGNYLLTDQIEVTNDRVDIEENVTDINTGYLIEYDYKVYDQGLGQTDDNYFVIDGIPFVLKSPDIDDDHYSYQQYSYIESYMTNVFRTLKNKDDYSDIIDEASFIDWFIVNELFKNVDSGYSSIFYYKEKNDVLKMGPIWDFDLSSGNYGHLQEDLRGPEGWYTSLSYKNILFHYLMEYDSFRYALKERWNSIYEDVILELVNAIYPMADSIAKSRYDNFMTWDIIGSYEDWFISPEILALETYHEQVYFLRVFLIDRMTWLNEEINKF